MVTIDYRNITDLPEMQKLIAAKEKEIRQLKRKIAYGEKMRDEKRKREKQNRKTEDSAKEDGNKKRNGLEDLGEEPSITEPCAKRQRSEQSSSDSPPPEQANFWMNYPPPAPITPVIEQIDGVPISELVMRPPPEGEIDGLPISELVKRPPPNVIREIQDRECAKPAFYSNIQNEIRWWN